MVKKHFNYPLSVSIVNQDGMLIKDRNFWARYQVIDTGKRMYTRIIMYSNGIEPIKLISLPVDMLTHALNISKKLRGTSGTMSYALRKPGIKYSEEAYAVMNKNCIAYKNWRHEKIISRSD